MTNGDIDMKFVYNDGGREAAGFKGHTGDCVTRAIAIATGKPYRDVYDDLNRLGKTERTGIRKRGKSTARNGVYKKTTRKYLESLGWTWTPTMFIGSGCTVHLTDGELPNGRLIVSVSRHLTAVIDGVIYDTHDPQRRTYWYGFGDYAAGRPAKISERCVYGYWTQAR